MGRFIFTDMDNNKTIDAVTIKDVIEAAPERIEPGFRYYFTCRRNPKAIKIGDFSFRYSIICNRFPFEGGQGTETVIGYSSRYLE